MLEITVHASVFRLVFGIALVSLVFLVRLWKMQMGVNLVNGHIKVSLVTMSALGELK